MTPPRTRESWATTAATRRVMQANRSRDTGPELELRRLLHAQGLGYRLRHGISGTRRNIDIAFIGARVAVHVRGCFWHACPSHGTSPRSNHSYWADKLRRNADRDAETDALLVERGWHVVVVWEHDDMTVASREIARIVRRRREGQTSARGARRSPPRDARSA